jgi:hypothetical protein
VKVGDTLWLFDINRRVYPRDEKGRATGSPIWREHWVPHEITGETSRSWLIGWRGKVPKKGGRGIAFDAAEIDRNAWVIENRYRISESVRQCDDFDRLCAAARLFGIPTPTPEGGG